MTIRVNDPERYYDFPLVLVLSGEEENFTSPGGSEVAFSNKDDHMHKGKESQLSVPPSLGSSHWHRFTVCVLALRGNQFQEGHALCSAIPFPPIASLSMVGSPRVCLCRAVL